MARRLSEWHRELIWMLQPDGRQVTPESADKLAATADDLAISEGLNDRTTAAIHEAVQAARAVLSRDGSRESRRRLSRTLWRQAAGLTTAGRIQEAVGPAREAIELARQAVRETGPDDPALDTVCGEFGLRVVDLSQILGAAGHGEEAQRLITESAEVTRRGDGPLSARARTGTMQIMVSGLVDVAVRAMSAGRQPPADAALVIGAAEKLVRDLRAIMTEDDPTTFFDLAQGLHVLGHACLIVGRPEQAVGTLSEALAIFCRFDGLAALGKAQEVREELERVNDIMRRPAAPGRNADPG
jgi:nucleoside diphosphate kinase